MTQPSGGRLVDTTEACRILNVSNRSTISRYVKEGQLEPALTVGRAFLFKRSDVERLAKRRAA